LLTFESIGKKLQVRVTLNDSTAGVSPEFDKINILYK